MAESGGENKIWPELEKGAPGPVYGVFGEEDFLVNQCLERFGQSPAFAQNASLNQERFHAGDSAPAKVLESALTMPFLGKRRLIIISELENYKAAQLAEFVNYLEKPVDTATLVFAGLKLDQRLKFSKLLNSAGKVHTFKKMYARQLVPWLKERAAARDKALGNRAAVILSELAGLGLSALDSEVEKLALFVGGRAKIGLEDVQTVVGRGRLYSIFDFTDALAAGDLHRALTAYSQLDSLGEPAVRVLAMVQRLFKQLVTVRGILDGGGGQGDVQRELRIPPQATQTLYSRARREKASRLSGRLARILETDLALKSSPGSDRVIMERLVMDLCVS